MCRRDRTVKIDDEESKPEEKPTVPLSALFRYASLSDKFMLFTGLLAAFINGTIYPLFTLIFGALLNDFNTEGVDLQKNVARYALYFILIAIGAGMCTFLEVALPGISAARQITKVRIAFVKSLLRQEMAYFDKNPGGEAVSKLSENSIQMSLGMAEKLSLIVRSFSTVIVGLVLGFYTSWKLTLVIMGTAPAFAIALGVLIRTFIAQEKISVAAYSKAGAVANEVIEMIRSVAAFGGEQHEIRRYDAFLAVAERAGFTKARTVGVAVGIMLFCFYGFYGISTWAAVQFIKQSRDSNAACNLRQYSFNSTIPSLDGCFNGGDAVQALIAVLQAAISFGQVGPLFGNISSARAAAASLFEVIDREPEIDSLNEKGKVAEENTGKIEFKNVSFSYPSRPDLKVLENFNLTIAGGETVALVGESGSGKSTLVQLLERYYDCTEGQVLVDGVDVKEWQIKALRARMGLVQQDPLLFGVSVAKNIMYGLGEDRELPLDGAVPLNVEAAAKAANAHSFVSKLPEGYNTSAGTSVSSSQLSGGQRQRICIARALIRNPKIMLLDEATSALDTESERVVQQSINALISGQAVLEGVAQGSKRTTIMIAHRLSTVTNADRIVVLSRGRIVEEGSHSQLMQKQGAYASMRAAQEIAEGASPSTGFVSPSTAVLSNAETFPKDSPTTASKLQSKSYKLKPRPVSFLELWRGQAHNCHWMIIGALGAMFGGSLTPIFSIVYSGIITTFFEKDDEKMQSEALKYLGYFFAIGFAAFFAVICRNSIWGILGEKLTRELRLRSFKAIVRQPMAFFDEPDNSVGLLSTRLSSEASLVRGANTDIIGSFFEAFANIVGAIIISFVSSWRMALVLLSVFPLLIMAGIFAFDSIGLKQGKASGGDVITEAMGAIRTVQAFSLQTRLLDGYIKSQEDPERGTKRTSFKQGLGQGFQRFITQATFSLCFYVGSYWIRDGILQFSDLLRVFLAVTLAAEACGRISSLAPDQGKAKEAAESIFALLDSVKNSSEIDPLDSQSKPDFVSPKAMMDSTADAKDWEVVEYKQTTDGPARSLYINKKSKQTRWTSPIIESKGNIVFEKVNFSYPTRPDLPVLKNFSLIVEPGSTVAIVGPSGSGKSTIVQLLERFYDPNSGSIFIDGQDIKSVNVESLRAQLSLVQQEPPLFADSIAYNIEYGKVGREKAAPGKGYIPKEEKKDKKDKKDSKGEAKIEVSEESKKENVPTSQGHQILPKESVTLAVEEKYDFPPPSDQVVKSAQVAHAANFIENAQHKYATYCGTRGNQLSGGQKQRVAIARAVMRETPILLLDEATSALDSASEAQVQAALDELLSSRTRQTTIVIAHRLSTITKADKIVVLQQGQIVETGNHQELFAKDGVYRKLVQAQAAEAH